MSRKEGREEERADDHPYVEPDWSERWGEETVVGV